MTHVTLICPQCNKEFQKKAYSYRYGLRNGVKNFFCSNACVGLSKKRDEAEKRSDWLAYLKAYHEAHKEKRHAQARERHVRSYDPEKRRQEYLKPGVAEREREQGKVRRAKQEFGEFWESAVLVRQIRETVNENLTREQIRREKGYFERKYERKKRYERPNSQEPETGPLVNLERGTRR